jgi:glycosyltransferase involved in cell wall biosynthesis
VRPLVSVVVPSYQQGRFLRSTLESILAQDHRPIEAVVVDGGSTDETVDVLRSFSGAPEVRWTSEKDAGVVDAVNRGLARAQGEVLTIQSSDDRFAGPHVVSEALRALEAEPDVGLVYGNVRTIDADDRVLEEERLGPFDLASYLARMTWIPQTGAFFRRSVQRSAGPWRPEVSYAADADLWLRIAFRSKVRWVDSTFGVWRRHEAQRDTSRELVRRDWERMIRESDDLRSAPSRLRRAARAGLHRAHIRYGSPGALGICRRSWASIAWWPPSWRVSKPRRYLVPGLPALLGAMSRVRRAVVPRRASRLPVA